MSETICVIPDCDVRLLCDPPFCSRHLRMVPDVLRQLLFRKPTNLQLRADAIAEVLARSGVKRIDP